jgi:ATP diphosphatase
MPTYTILDALKVMQQLRDPQTGCPWDVKQTFETIVPCTLEEVYEVVDAIDRKDFPHLKDELGDLLLQILFYAQMADEAQHFNFEAVVDNLVNKLIRRHPHVFPKGDLQPITQQAQLTDKELRANWEAIKQSEKPSKLDVSALAGVPLALPAIQRAEKLQKKAAKTGFDWACLSDIVDKLREEIEEFEASVTDNDDISAIESEVGDLLFTCVNIARYLHIDAETALRSTNHKFERRFRRVESLVREHNLEKPTLTQMDLFWDQAKDEGL